MHNGILNFKEEALTLPFKYPTWVYSETEVGIPCLIGELKLQDEEGLYIDSYQIKILPSNNYPYQFPLVFETSKRIPINTDWHVFADGHACIKSEPEEIYLCKAGINLIWFIETQVKPYFFNQKYRELNGFFLNERAHGVEGNIAFFEEIFATTDLQKIVKSLFFIHKRKEPKRTEACFCGSGRKYRKCHKDAFQKLSIFTNDELKRFAKLVTTSTRYTYSIY